MNAVVYILSLFRPKPQPLGNDPAYVSAYTARKAVGDQHCKVRHLNAAVRDALHAKLADEVWP